MIAHITTIVCLHFAMASRIFFMTYIIQIAVADGENPTRHSSLNHSHNPCDCGARFPSIPSGYASSIKTSHKVESSELSARSSHTGAGDNCQNPNCNSNSVKSIKEPYSWYYSKKRIDKRKKTFLKQLKEHRYTTLAAGLQRDQEKRGQKVCVYAFTLSSPSLLLLLFRNSYH